MDSDDKDIIYKALISFSSSRVDRLYLSNSLGACAVFFRASDEEYDAIKSFIDKTFKKGKDHEK